MLQDSYGEFYWEEMEQKLKNRRFGQPIVAYIDDHLVECNQKFQTKGKNMFQDFIFDGSSIYLM